MHRRAHPAPREHAHAPHRHCRALVAQPSLLRRSLRACTAEGVVAEFAAACSGAGALTAWALHLGAARWMIGLLGALPFLAQLVQIPAAYITARLGLRRVAIASITTSRLVYAALIGLPFLPIGLGARLAILASVAAASAVIGAIGGNAWNTWMGELVPSTLRGRYFGRRTAMCTLGGAVASLLAGAVLDAARRAGRTDVSLSIMAIVICVAAVVCGVLMARMHRPPVHGTPPAMRWADAAVPLADAHGRRALAYQAAWGVASGLASGLYALYMIEELHLGFFGATLHAAVFALARMLAAPLWGSLVDRAGARPVLIAASLGLAITSSLWAIVTPSLVWLLAVDAIGSGALDAGKELGSLALPLRLASREKRPFYLAAFAMAGGLAFAAAAGAGGAVVSALPTRFEIAGTELSSFGVLFFGAAVLRGIAAIFAARVIDPGSRTVRALAAPLLARLPRPAREAGIAGEIAG